VTYAALQGECNAATLSEVPFFMGGELILKFWIDDSPLIITWDENAGWPDHFSVQVRRSSAFNSGSLDNWDESDHPTWQPHVGTSLSYFRVVGLNDTPHVIEFGFPGGGVLVGDGHRGEFGDGDDVIILSAASWAEHDAWKELAFEAAPA
jgi:hypothetical protein